MKALIVVLIVLCPILVCYGSEAEQWREDLQFLAERLPQVHANAFHAVGRDEFAAAVKNLDARIPSLTRDQFIVELMRLVAMIGDGHTSFTPLIDSSIGFRYYPIQLYSYSDGIFVKKAVPALSDIAGARLLQIGDTPVEEVWKGVSPLISRDNEMGVKTFAPLYLVVPEILKALGFIQDEAKAKFVFESNGKRIEKVLTPQGLVPNIHHGMRMYTNGWADALSGAPPLSLKNRNDGYWYEYLPDSRTMYVQYSQVHDKDEETISAFFGRVFHFVEQNPVEKFILDVRFNMGGNNYLNKPVLLGLIQSKKINQRGKLFVIIGRETFSAAQNLVNEIEKYTNAIFVGEETAENVNFYGDHEPIVLPNTKFTVLASTLWWQINPKDKRKATSPQIRAELKSSDYRGGFDPALNSILRCKYESLDDALAAGLSKNDSSAIRSAFDAFANDPSHACVNVEVEMNRLGYQLMSEHRMEQAIEVFKLNAEKHPDSWNAHDSLGEAFRNAGQKQMAIRSYQKAIELNPDSSVSRQALQDLISNPH